MRREHAATRETIASKSDVKITVLFAAQNASLDGIDALLATLPHGPVEPSLLRLELDEGALLSFIRTAGTVLAPRGVHAACVVVRGLPMHAHPGRPLQFELALYEDYPCRARAELEAAAASLAFHARVVVSLETGAESQCLQALLVPSAGGIVSISIAIPESAGRDAEVVVSSVTVAGQHVAGGQALPMRLRVIFGMQAPLMMCVAANMHKSTPTITPEGTLYAPLQESTDVLVYSANGTPLPSLQLMGFGLSTSPHCAAFVEATGTLLLADYNDTSKLVAVDAASRAVRWSAALGGSCCGISVLPAQGVVIVSDNDLSMLHVHRLSDGVRVASAKAKEVTYVAADPASGTVRQHRSTLIVDSVRLLLGRGCGGGREGRGGCWHC
jgi:hypothetical protein